MLRFILPIFVLLVGNTVAVMLFFSEPETKKRPQKKHIPIVEVQPLQQESYTLKIRSSGKVKARTETQLVTEIAGKVIKLSDAFTQGNRFKKNDILLQLEDSDYEYALTIAQAEVEKAKLNLKEEENKAALANRDWQLLDRQDTSLSEMASRKPHIANAKSALTAAEAKLAQAKKNLERTFIKAPYTGYVLERKVAIGQYIRAGEILGSIYADDQLEVHLPISLTKNQLLTTNKKNKPAVEYSITLGRKTQTWQGNVLRSSASIDPDTNQLTLIASIDTKSNKSNLKIGQFLRANISGKTYRNIYRIPRSALRKNQEVLLAVKKKVHVKPVELLHVDGDQVIIKADLPEKSNLIITPMPLAKEGLVIKIKGAQKENKTDPEVSQNKPSHREGLPETDVKARQVTDNDNKSEKPVSG
ncbi:MAG: efflux RND transporter periplasmic adaptor subunit [bacterium]